MIEVSFCVHDGDCFFKTPSSATIVGDVFENKTVRNEESLMFAPVIFESWP